MCSISAESRPLPVLTENPVKTLLNLFPDRFIDGIRLALPSDTLSKKVLNHTSVFPPFKVYNGLLFIHDPKGYLLVIPQGFVVNPEEGEKSTLVEATIQYGHVVLGHLGAAKTLSYLRRFFWWSQMQREVFDHCRLCEVCSRNKSSLARPFGRLHPLPTPDCPFSIVLMDFVVSLPRVKHHGSSVDTILTITCLLAKLVVLIPLSLTATASDVAVLFFEYFYRRFGLPCSIVSDRNPKSMSLFWEALCKKLDIKLWMSTSAHPETDGRSEVTNKVVGSILRCYCEDTPLEWADRITEVEFAINLAPSSATSLSPFEITFGFLPSPFPVDSWSLTTFLSVEDRMESLRFVWLRATNALIASCINMVHKENKH